MAQISGLMTQTRKRHLAFVLLSSMDDEQRIEISVVARPSRTDLLEILCLIRYVEFLCRVYV